MHVLRTLRGWFFIRGNVVKREAIEVDLEPGWTLVAVRQSRPRFRFAFAKLEVDAALCDAILALL